MRRASSWVLCWGVASLFAGCIIGPRGDGSSDGTGNGGSGGAGGEGGGASGCETSQGCASCSQCAAKSLCEVEVERCLANIACANIDQCIADCGPGPTCIEVCRSQYLVGAEDYDRATSCLYCDACPKSCKPEAIANECKGEGGAGGAR